MLCTVVRSAGDSNDWRGRKMGEVLGFHFFEKQAKVLATFYLQNNCENGHKNYIHILHPGNVHADMVTSPLPSHPDEKCKGFTADNILQYLFGNAFNIVDNGEIIWQVRALSPWDTWHDMTKCERVNWPNDPRNLDNCPHIDRVSPEVEYKKEEFTPFTVWRVGPFTKKGPVIFSLEILIEAKTFEELILSNGIFTVDGPTRLLSRIKHKYLPLIAKSDREDWMKELVSFNTYIKSDAGYDIVILGQDYADEPSVEQKSCINEAFLQPQAVSHGMRYSTDKSNFTISLKHQFINKVNKHDLNHKNVVTGA